MTTAGAVKHAMEAFPLAPLDTITGAGSVLVLAPHADDESLGCGGLIAAAAAAGRPVSVLVLTDGSQSHPSSPTWPKQRLVVVRQQEVRDALDALGLAGQHLAFLNLPDAAAPTRGPAFESAVAAIAAHVAARGAATVLAPWEHDPHCDHEAAHLMAAEVCQRLDLRHWAYPVWGWTLADAHPLPEMPAGIRLDVSGQLPQKRRAIACHATQYTDLINDDPAGFRLPPGLLAVFDRPFETFLHLR